MTLTLKPHQAYLCHVVDAALFWSVLHVTSRGAMWHIRSRWNLGVTVVNLHLPVSNIHLIVMVLGLWFSVSPHVMWFYFLSLFGVFPTILDYLFHPD